MERVQQALQGLKKERLLRSRGAFKHSAPFVKDSVLHKFKNSSHFEAFVKAVSFLLVRAYGQEK